MSSNVRNADCISPNVVIISGVGSRDYSEFKEIWTVVKSEDLFLFYLFKMIIEATLLSKFLCY